MAADDILLDTEERMEKAIEILKKNLGGIRTGRANPGLVDSIRVDVYGSPTPLKQIASIGAPEPAQIVIRPYDTSTIKDIEKAIGRRRVGLQSAKRRTRSAHQHSPVVDGKSPQVRFPH